MAVKVMVATAIAREPEKPEKKPRAQGEEKPKRRRSSVYDADGNEVFITLMCLKCHKMRPLSQFGLRKMADGAIRNQPWCRGCRSGAGAGAGKKKEEAVSAAPSLEPVAAPPVLAAPEAPAVPAASQAAPARPANPSAQIAAALAAGLGRR
ncbi:hypothetical protein [Anaeromyxobacter paludicola]|uniref:Cytochrome c domain-containing protein n=1 Tax=Anaeromyxobacter paludicola TaxID=2918171 RepID=A0ABM7XET0_9BACT|nr:hypothetical protein [Anaeromyxobacter paludicola]BDG10398.1 hypothetical protein AMPC_35110 [Anaeromyxobacter paludicola]